VDHLSADLFIKAMIGMLIHFHHDGVSVTLVSFCPKETVGDTAVDLRQRDHLLPLG
jgi:hypothetical protein